MAHAFLFESRNKTTQMQEPPHIGKIIRQTIKNQGRTVTWLAGQLHYTRDNMYKIFAKQWLDTRTLIEISRILQVDLFQIYSEYLKENRN